MKIIAHRGASTYKTENTMPAFKTAIDMHADGIELDIRLTKDGIPVIHHDPTINRLSNGKGSIHELTLQQLQTYTFKKKVFPFQKREQIVTLEDFFTYIRDYPKIELHIELKNDPVLEDDLEEKVLRLSEEYQLEDQIVYSSFDHESLQRIHELKPTAKIGLLFNKEIPDLIDYIEQTGMPIYSIHPKYTLVTDEMVQEAHKHDIKVNPYTVNSPRTAKKLRNLGVDGIITNNPQILNENE